MGRPLAYLLTWTCRGTWLHGDERGSVGREQNRPGSALIVPDPQRRGVQRRALAQPPVTLVQAERDTVEGAIREVCDRRGWRLLAVAARTTHVHAMVNASDDAPERVMQQLKAWSTRAVLRVRPDAGPGLWTRHGSTRYLWTAEGVAEKLHYVEHEQDGPGAARRHEAMIERFKETEPRV